MAGALRRGDVATIVAPRDYGKPRPAVVVQTDFLNPTHASIVFCPFTTTERIDAPRFRLDFPASKETGLRHASQLMIDKIVALPLERVGRRIGSLSSEQMTDVDKALSVVLGLAERGETADAG